MGLNEFVEHIRFSIEDSGVQCSASPIVVPFFGHWISRYVISPIARLVNKIFAYKFVSFIASLLVLAAIITFLVIDSAEETERLISLGGVFIIIAFGFIFSAHPGHVRWRSVFWGLGIEFIFGLLVLRWEVSKNALYLC